MLVKTAKQYGNISTGNTKMPGTTFAIDAFACKVGSKLAKVAGTPCASCYARRIQKFRPNVDAAWKRNLALWQATEPAVWEQAMAFQILRYNSDGYHRWFDSGDLQSVQMLKSIVNVCLMTPNVEHWLPTQERGILKKYLTTSELPSNIVVRVSASKVNGLDTSAIHTSNVFDKNGTVTGTECKARSRGNACGPCRACWDKGVSNVSYPKH